MNASAVDSATRGLVGESAFAVLPDITPRTTTILTLLFQVVRFNYLLTTEISANHYYTIASSNRPLPSSDTFNLPPRPAFNSSQLLPFDLPCSRKSNRYSFANCFSSFNSIANLPPCLPSPRTRCARFSLPAPLQYAGASYQTGLYNLLDRRYFCRVRSTSTKN